jgi:D-alanyl-D-alanine carboxypeptidase/D-alanyl-D-alanine-endopeptidase (penicillin-binding protein 4)
VASALDGSSLRRAWDKRERRMGSHAGAYVVDLGLGRVLYRRNADRPLAPASNEKLLTTSAALVRLGPDTTLDTIVRPAPDAVLQPDGTLQGDLILVGAGDPTLNDVALRDLIAQLRTAGIRRITGAVVGDESLFDSRRGSYDSRWGYDSDLGGELGALTWGHGAFDSRGPAYYAASRLR